MRAMSVLAVAATPALVATLSAGACSFPEVSFLNGGGSTSSASTTSGPGASSSGVGPGGVGGQGGAGGEGGASSASGGGQGGVGGVGQGGGQGGGGGVDCTVPDKDMDGSNGTECGGNDCDDANEDVFVEQIEWFGKPRANGSYDYNCNDAEEKEFATHDCTGGLCAAKTSVFLTDAMCGQMASFGDCNAICQTSNLQTKTMRCR